MVWRRCRLAVLVHAQQRHVEAPARELKVVRVAAERADILLRRERETQIVVIGEITGGFSEQQARDLATQLNAGALPVELTRQSVRTVSPTLGDESLREGIIAGLATLARSNDRRRSAARATIASARRRCSSRSR